MSLMMAESVSASVPSKSKISQGGDGWEETGAGNITEAEPVDILSYPLAILRPAGGQVNPDASAALAAMNGTYARMVKTETLIAELR
jgi:hypothetical protein